MKNRITIVITSFFLAMFLCQNVSAQKYRQLDKQKSKKIDNLFSKWVSEKSPGASVALVKNSQIVFANSYGFASLEFNIKNTPQTLFNINSNSKQFTTYALMTLVNQGLISLDDDIRKHIPELPDFGSKITVRNLAQHTHGIRGITPLLGMAGWSVEDLVSREDVLKLLSQQKELDFTPGTNFSYNNTGYMLLAEIVERVSGESFHTYVDKVIFTPMGMEDTQLLEDYEKVLLNMSSPYYYDGTTYKKAVRNFKDIVGNTGIRTNVVDLSKWLINFESLAKSKNDIGKQLLEPTILTSGNTLDYCLGLKKGKHNGRTVIRHGGADIGFRSQVLRFPEEGVAVIVLSNNGSLNADQMAHDIADIYFDDEKSATSAGAVSTGVFCC